MRNAQHWGDCDTAVGGDTLPHSGLVCIEKEVVPVAQIILRTFAPFLEPASDVWNGLLLHCEGTLTPDGSIRT
jgi:hypothetical protein